MSWFSDLIQKLNQAYQTANPLAGYVTSQMQNQAASQGLIGEGREMQSQGLGMMQDILTRMQDEYKMYGGQAQGMFGDVNYSLGDFISGMQGLQGDVLSSGQQYAGQLGNIFERTAADVRGQQQAATGYASSMLKDYQRSAGMIEDVSQAALEESMGSLGSYMRGMRSLAQQDLPGVNIMRGQAGAQTAQSLQRLRDAGGGSEAGITSLLTGEQDRMQDLALQSSVYKAQRRQDLAQAYSNLAQQQQNVYANRQAGIAQAAGLRGAGLTNAQQVAMSNAGISQNLGQMGLGATQAASGIMSGAYNQAAGIQQAMAGIPMAQLGFYQNMLGQTNPYQSGLGVAGDITGLGYSQAMSGLGLNQQNSQESMNIIKTLLAFM